MPQVKTATGIALLTLAVWIGSSQPAAATTISPEFMPALPVTIEDLAVEREPDVACGASTCLSVWRGPADRLMGARASSAGALVDPREVLIAPGATSSAVILAGSSFVVAWTAFDDGAYRVRARTVTEAGAWGPVIEVASATASLGDVAAAALGSTTLLAWRANAPDEGSSDVRGARLGADGGVLDPAGLNIGYGAGFQREPAVAASGAQFIVTFSDARSGSYDIYGARVSAAGAVSDGGGVPISNASGDQTGPSVAAGSTGAMVAWTDGRSGNQDVYVTRLSTSFTVLDPVGLPMANDAGSEETAGGLIRTETGYQLVWDAGVSGNTVGSLVVANISEEGVPAKTTVVPSTGSGPNTPRLALLGTGSALVWCDNTSGRAVRFTRLSAQRSALDAPPLVLSNGVDEQQRPTVSYDGTNYLVAWFERRGTGATGLVRAARVAPDGTMLDPGGLTLATGVPFPEGASSLKHLLAAYGSGSHLLVWTAGGDIVGARVGTNGAVLDATPLAIAASGAEEKEPALASGGAAGWFVAYTRVGATTDVLGTRITTAGAVLDPAGLGIGTSTSGSEARPAVAFGGGAYAVVYYFPASGLVRHHTVSTGGVVSGFTTISSGNGPPLAAAASDHLLIGWTTVAGSVFAGRFTFAGGVIASPQFLGSSFNRPPEFVNAGGYWVGAFSLSASDTVVEYYASDLSRQARENDPDFEQYSLAAGPPGTVALASSRLVDEAPFHGVRRTFVRTLRRHAVAAAVTQNAAVEGQPVQFKVTVTPARLDTTVLVDYTVVGSSASSGSDFPATSGSLSFPPGVTEKFVTVPTTDDAVDEEDTETLFLQLDGATGADLDDVFGTHRTSGTATIGDNDPSPSVSAADVTVSESAGKATVTLQTSGAGARTGRVFLTQWTPLTASNPADFTFPASSVDVTFAPGQTQKSVDVPIIADSIYEGDEFFTLRVSGAQALTVSDEFVVVTIAEDDPVPSLAVAPVSITEGDSLTTPAQVSVSLSNASAQTITAKLSTGNGTATAPGDYSAVTDATVTFNPGTTVRTTAITVISDSVDELDETFAVTLSQPTNATIASASADVTILDDDGPNLTVADASAGEGSQLGFQISLSAPTGQPVSGTCTTADAGATAGADYSPRAAVPYSIPAGATGTSVTVDSLGDSLDEADETLGLTCTVNLAAELADGVATGTITDDDAPPTLSMVAPADVVEGDGSPRTADLTVRLDTPSGRTVSATLNTSDGSAAAPSDYTALSGVAVSLAPGDTERTVTLSIVADTSDEADETLSAALTNVGAAVLGVSSADVAILDDDGPVVSVSDARVGEGNSGSAPLAFLINLSTASPQAVTGTCETSNATATAAADYTTASAPFTVGAGATQGAFSVNVLGDTVDEADETLALTCTVDRTGELGDGAATGTIVDDDVPAGSGGPGGSGGSAAPTAAIAAGKLKLDRRGRATVTLNCPAFLLAPACTGRLALTTAAKVPVGGKRRTVALGRTNFTVARGSSAKVVIRLSKANIRLVRRLKKVRVVAAAGAVKRTLVLHAR